LARHGLYLPDDYFDSIDVRGLYKGREISVTDAKKRPADLGPIFNPGGRPGLNPTTYYIPIKIWAYMNTAGEAAITQAEIEVELDNLQSYFRQNGIPIEFFIKCPISWVTSNLYYNIGSGAEALAMFNTRKDGNAMNVHIVNDAPNAGMATTFNSLYISDLRDDATLAHEIGHNLGLDHTHRGEGCIGDNEDCNNCLQEPVSRTMTQPFSCGAINNPKKCAVNGDDLCDTPAEPNLLGEEFVNFLSCAYIPINPNPTDNWGVTWQPNTTNIMSYSWGRCTDFFSWGQVGIMLSKIPNYASTSNSYSISGTTSVCTGQSYTYTAATVGGATSYQWQVPEGWPPVVGNGNRTVTITPTNNAEAPIIYVTAMPCGTKPAKKELSFLPTSFTISGYAEIPIGQSSTYTTGIYSGATNYNWTIPSGWTLESGQGTVIIYVKPQSNAQNGWVNVSATVCNSTIWGSKYVTIGNGGGGPIALNTGPEQYFEDTATNISFYPNPANDVLVLALPKETQFISAVKIIDAASGKILKNYDRLSSTEQIDICTLRTGNYFLRYYLNGRVKTFRFIKQ
jgi:PKD-like domain/Secretion system C-terminal sorting domain/Metallo-peptidase family M12